MFVTYIVNHMSPWDLATLGGDRNDEVTDSIVFLFQPGFSLSIHKL